MFRPPGGALADRIGPARVLEACLAAVVAMAIWQSFQPTLFPAATIALLVMAAALGAGSGAVFSLLAKVTARDQVGSVTGIVGAIGGLGGFVPPLVMGAIHSATGSYRIGLLLLALVAAGALAYTFRIKAPAAPAMIANPHVRV